jgi:hypothetical protein
MIEAYPNIRIDGVEIDPAVADIGREYFGMTDPRISVIVADGRYALLKSDRQYDIIGVDAYRQPYIPFQLTTEEFFLEVADRLAPCGVAVVNVGRTETDYRLVDVVSSTMRAVFPAVYTIDVERYTNTMVIGTTCPSSIGSFGANFAALDVADPVLRPTAERSLVSGKMTEVAPGGRVFTDDHAPVELVVDLIIVDAARDEGT